MPFNSNVEAFNYIIGAQFIGRNPGFEPEQKLVREGKLVVHHHTLPPNLIGSNIKSIVQLRSADGVGQEGEKLAKDAVFWYRAMSHADFKYLRKNDEFFPGDSYGGIATNAKYVKGYMSNEGTHTHLVEVNTYTKKFYEYLKDWAARERRTFEDCKAEGDGGTFGLGATGHYKGDAGVQFNYFMQHEGPSWRLVHVYLTVR